MKLVDLRKQGFLVEPRYYFYGWSESNKILARESAVAYLKKAQEFLPENYKLKIWDCYRPIEVQKLMIQSFRRRLKNMYPDADKAEIEKLVFTFAGKPTKVVKHLDSHRNGGAFDLTIVDNDGKELYMGTDFDDLTECAATDYFETENKLSTIDAIARENRILLKRAMVNAGFANYDKEWWHWSIAK